MASLLTLPNELVLHIFTACPSIQAAARLSKAARCLREIWLENIERIAAEVLQSKIPEYDEAVKLAKYEVGENAALAEWMPRLLHNADLALDVCNSFQKLEDDCSSKVLGLHSEELSSVHASYYMLRQLVEACSKVSIQSAVSSAIDASSLQQARTHRAMSTFLFGENIEDDLVQRHHMARPEDTWTWEEKEDGRFGLKDDWDWADRVICLVWMEKLRPGFTAPDLPCPWRFGNVCCGRDCGRGQSFPGDIRPSVQ